MRTLALPAVLFLVSCTIDLEAPRDDQLDRTDPAPTMVAADGGAPLWPGEQDIELGPIPQLDDGCRSSCAETCMNDEACCESTGQCLSLDCVGCCPDADFGFDELRYGPLGT